MKWNFFKKLTPKSKIQMFMHNVDEANKIREDAMRHAKDVLFQAYTPLLSRILNYEMEFI